MITQKHLIALDYLRQFASEHPGLFRAFLRDSSIPEEKADKVAVEQIRLAEELHLDIAKINYELQELMMYLRLKVRESVYSHFTTELDRLSKRLEAELLTKEKTRCP